MKQERNQREKRKRSTSNSTTTTICSQNAILRYSYWRSNYTNAKRRKQQYAHAHTRAARSQLIRYKTFFDSGEGILKCNFTEGSLLRGVRTYTGSSSRACASLLWKRIVLYDDYRWQTNTSAYTSDDEKIEKIYDSDFFFFLKLLNGIGNKLKRS